MELPQLLSLLRAAAPAMLQGAGYTLLFAPAAMVGGLAIGVPVALCLAAAAIYWVLSLVFEQMQRLAERRLNRAHPQHR